MLCDQRQLHLHDFELLALQALLEGPEAHALKVLLTELPVIALPRAVLCDLGHEAANLGILIFVKHLQMFLHTAIELRGLRPLRCVPQDDFVWELLCRDVKYVEARTLIGPEDALRDLPRIVVLRIKLVGLGHDEDSPARPMAPVPAGTTKESIQVLDDLVLCQYHRLKDNKQDAIGVTLDTLLDHLEDKRTGVVHLVVLHADGLEAGVVAHDKC
mmetsp:Transcript_46795/g.102224  ORF Transcript_46795/g.102224 Transcript_46795/m.102224 type:complete len:215 (-) Transcript_46795:1098-1742(-)